MMDTFKLKCEARSASSITTESRTIICDAIKAILQHLYNESRTDAVSSKCGTSKALKQALREPIRKLVLLRQTGSLNFEDVKLLANQDLALDVLAHLTSLRILSLHHYIDRMIDEPERTTNFTRTLTDAIFANFQSRDKTVTQIMSDLIATSEVFEGVLQMACRLIVENVSRKYWTRINSGESGCNPFVLLLHSTSVSHDVLRPTFRRVLKYLMTFKPEIKIANAFIDQDSWGFFCVEPLVAESLISMLVPFAASDVLSILCQVLESKEVNWRTVLLCFSAFILRFDNGAAIVRDLLRTWLTESLHEQQQDRLLTALLVTRQMAGEGQHIFPSYQRWLSETFGDLSSSPASSAKRYAYLIDTLISLLPHESLAVLKAHVAKPPAPPQDMKYKLNEFLNKTKARIAELDDCYDTPFTIRSKVDQDVATAIEMFDKNGKVPNTLMEASIFRMPYFQGKFLPTLLAPRVIPEYPDARERLIVALREASKIPSSTYASYQASCRQYAEQLAEGLFMDDEEPEESVVCVDID